MRTTSARRFCWRLVLAAVTVAGIGLGSAQSATAAESTNYGIRPADAPDHFRIDLAPGSATERTAVVSNRSGKTVTFKIYPVDALTTAQGGFALRSATEPRTGVGSWVQVPLRSVTVKPGKQVKVPFRLEVPAGATPGDYAGGIVIEAPPRRGTPGELDNSTAVQLNIVERVGVRVYLDVAGVAIPELTAGPLTYTETPRGLRFKVTLHNTGNVTLHPKARLALRGWPGSSSNLRFSRVETLLPDQTVTLRAMWADPPAATWGQAVATIRHEGGQQRLTTAVHLLPLLPAAAAVLLLSLAVWLAVRVTRFVRRARRALASTAPACPDRRARAPVQPPGEPASTQTPDRAAPRHPAGRR